MDLAAAAVALLVPFFKRLGGRLLGHAEEEAFEALRPRLEALYERVKAKLGSGTYEGVLLQGLEQEPDAAERQDNLTRAVAAAADADEEFRASLAELVEEAEAAGAAVLYVTAQDSGITAGGDVDIQAGGNVSGRDQSINYGSFEPP